MDLEFQVFRAGRQTDSSGNSREWTVEDLDKIVNSYNPQFHEAPICIGHPKDNSPAYGWVKSLVRQGDAIVAKVESKVEEFAEAVRKGMFKKRSISLYPDLSLRHIAFLGAQPPAVKGLEDFQFSEPPALTYEFGEGQFAYLFNRLGDALQGMREWFIGQGKQEEADRILSQYIIDDLKTARPAEMVPEFSEEKDMDKIAELQAEIAELKASKAELEGKVSQFSEQVTAEKARADKAEGKVIELEQKAQELEFSSFCEKMVMAGKLLPAERENQVAIMRALAGSTVEMEFSEGDAKVKKTALKAHMDSIEARPKNSAVDFSEVARKNAAFDGDRDEKIQTLTQEKMRNQPSLNYTEASRQVLAEHPELVTIIQ